MTSFASPTPATGVSAPAAATSASVSLPTPAVSVIVPMYNSAAYLPECLASIECQTLRDIEVLCVDDASSDESAAIAEAFAAQDGRFRLLRLRENGGASAARNHALSLARGQFVAFMDADDLYPAATTLEVLYRAAVDHGAQVAGGSFSELDMETGEVSTDFSADAYLADCFTFAEEGRVDYRSWQGDYGYQRFLFSCDLLRQNKLLFPPYVRHEDPLFFVKAMLAAEWFWAVPDVVYRYRVRHKGPVMSERAIEDATESILQIIEIAAVEGLARLRQHQYDLLRWYLFEVPVKREYGSWAEIGTIVKQQARDSLRLRIDRVLPGK